MSDIMKDAIKMEETTKRLSEKVISLLKEQYPDMSPRIVVNIHNVVKKMVTVDIAGAERLSDDELLLKLSMQLPLVQSYLEEKRRQESESFEQQFKQSTPLAEPPMPETKEVTLPVEEASLKVPVEDGAAIKKDEETVSDKPKSQKKDKKETSIDYKDFFSVGIGASKKVKDPAQRRREITTELQKLRMEKEFSNRSLSFRSEDMVIIDALKEYSKEHAIGFEGYELTSVKGILHFAVNTMMSHLIEQNHPALNSIHKAVLKERDRQALLDKKICELEEERMSLR